MALPVLAAGGREPAGALGTQKLTSAAAPTSLGERNPIGKGELPYAVSGYGRGNARNRARDVSSGIERTLRRPTRRITGF